MIVIDLNSWSFATDSEKATLPTDHLFDFRGSYTKPLGQMIVAGVPIKTFDRSSMPRVVARLAISTQTIFRRSVSGEFTLWLENAAIGTLLHRNAHLLISFSCALGKNDNEGVRHLLSSGIPQGAKT